MSGCTQLVGHSKELSMYLQWVQQHHSAGGWARKAAMGTAKISSPAKTKTRRGTESSLVLVLRDSLIFEDSSIGIFKNEQIRL